MNAYDWFAAAYCAVFLAVAVILWRYNDYVRDLRRAQRKWIDEGVARLEAEANREVNR